MPSRYRVGLTGGIGAGKSVVARVFAECGAAIIDADLLAREAVAPGSTGLASIAAHWPAVVAADGTLDRKKLGAIIFADEDARRALNAIVHPIVRALGEAAENEVAPGRLIVHDVPLLFEEGFADRCDCTVVVFAPKHERIARVTARDGISEEAVRQRMARQISPDEARIRATFVLENTGTLHDLQMAARDMYAVLRSNIPRNF